jgi:hypothetical protein
LQYYSMNISIFEPVQVWGGGSVILLPWGMDRWIQLMGGKGR